jgi:hypothetical protein
VAQGEPDNSLWYHFAWPGGQWNHPQVATTGRTLSAPSIFVGPTGEAIIVVESGGVVYYTATPGDRGHLGMMRLLPFALTADRACLTLMLSIRRR